MIQEIRLWVREGGNGTPRRLLNTITSSSKFATAPWFNRIEHVRDEHMIRLAKEQRNGWRDNGPWPHATFEIEAVGFKGEEVPV